MTKTEKILGLGVLIAMLIAVGAFLHQPKSVVSTGAVARTDISSTNFTRLTALEGLAVGSLGQFQVGSTGSLVEGGGVSATTTNGSATLTYSLFDTENVVSITQNVGSSMTATLPSASAITKLVNVGDSFTIKVVNGTTTASQPITFVAGSDMRLVVASSSASGGGPTKVLSSGEIATIEFTLATSTSFVTALYTPYK